MKKIALLALLVLAPLTSAAPNQDEYSITVHVSSSYIVPGAGSSPILSVIINGKKYGLNYGYNGTLLALGDYKAKLIKDEHKTAYESDQVYEFLFPDNKTRKFYVVGQYE
jgi:hypothetical protein